MKKILTAPQRNENNKAGERYGGNYVGYGLYVATDPFQTTSYGNVMIALDVPTNAPYTLGNSQMGAHGIECPFFGIMYGYNTSITGFYAAALRLDRRVHPDANPIQTSSVHAYFQPADETSILPREWVAPKVSKNQNLKAQKPFLDHYFLFIGSEIFEKSVSDVFLRGENSDDLRTTSAFKIALLKALKSEMVAFPQWAANGFRTISENPEELSSVRYKCGGPIASDPKFPEKCLVSRFISALSKGVDQNLSSGGKVPIPPTSPEETFYIAKKFNFISENEKNMNTADVANLVLNQWATVSKVESITAAVKSYREAVDYWRSNNIDAFVNGSGPAR
jgi:hypothetical protein